MSDLFARRRMLGRLSRLRLLLIAVGLVVVVTFGGWVVWFSSWVAVRNVEVVGARHIDVRELEQVAAVELGMPLARLDLSAVEGRLEQLPAVDVAVVERSWPHGVTIRITESTPVAALLDDGGYIALNAEGELFRQLPRGPSRLPVVRADQLEAERRAAALAEVAEVVSSLAPAIAAKVDHVEVASPDSIMLALRNGDQVEWGSAASSERKAVVLAALLHLDATVYDVRVPEQPATRS
ncbi:MAG: FtsQ-type POTRA domain-containing protein [Nocardioidaceae bacterium]|nr:FtsQ-type POTRA domain-containing protein [Nocardioidaceae bacterium]